ncbi:hypothetical protein Btru_068309 [Bulinus truncatus]|nr:hypothetical protein Btru_068309 [Bulinus truncatus]
MAGADHKDVNDKKNINYNYIKFSPKKYKIVCQDNGIDAIDRALNYVYPREENPVVSISSPFLKKRNGGSLPLDYIKVFLNTRGTDFKVAPHWHYITFGFSDLYGDGIVHEFSGRGKPSGYGFELTFRLKKEVDEKTPPVWPVTLLNNLSLYVFNTGIKLCAFDHIPWHDALNMAGRERSNNPHIKPCPSKSNINHMIIVDEPQILNLDTPNGTVHFLQNQCYFFPGSWSVKRRISLGKILENCRHCGSTYRASTSWPFALTDVWRNVSCFDLNPRFILDILSRIESEGTWLAKATCHVIWKEIVKETDNVVKGVENLSLSNDEDEIRIIKYVQLDFDANAGELLPIMLRGRLKHALNFMFVNPGCSADYDSVTIEFVPYNVQCSDDVFVTANNPIKAHVKKHHLQIYCGKALLQKMEIAFVAMERLREHLDNLPIRFMLKSALFEIIFNVCKTITCKHSS